jgi:hypothetical protein
MAPIPKMPAQSVPSSRETAPKKLDEGIPVDSNNPWIQLQKKAIDASVQNSMNEAQQDLLIHNLNNMKGIEQLPTPEAPFVPSGGGGSESS